MPFFIIEEGSKHSHFTPRANQPKIQFVNNNERCQLYVSCENDSINLLEKNDATQKIIAAAVAAVAKKIIRNNQLSVINNQCGSDENAVKFHVSIDLQLFYIMPYVSKSHAWCNNHFQFWILCRRIYFIIITFLSFSRIESMRSCIFDLRSYWTCLRDKRCVYKLNSVGKSHWAAL